jgi:flagellar protein FliO/FliZ
MKSPACVFLSALTLASPLTHGAEGMGAPAGLGVSPLGTGALMETAGGLLLILALIIGLGWLVRRYGRLPIAGKGIVTILGGVSLGPRERAVVLQVGDARLLVGVAPGRVQTLHVIEGSVDQVTEATGEAFESRLRTEMEATPP